jgi:DNA-binding CsgD family transcriptional regulator/catechol 2,3-dioxygenase-like lactoylglutathione lyase family enzyme
MARRGRPPSDDLLTPAEWRVANWVRHGLTNPAIAARLGVGIDAVKFHVGNVLAKLGLEDRSQLRRWSGVPRASALYRSRQTMHPLALGPIGQVARGTRDVARARRWYAEVLGLPHLYSFGTLAFFDCGGVRLFLSEQASPGPSSILYFRVDDIRSAEAELAARGVRFTHAPHMIHRHDDGTEEWMAFFEDPDGQPLALMSQVRPAATG